MKINVTNENNALKISLSGRLDSVTSDELSQAIAANLNSTVESLTIDLKDVDFISSKGLRVLVSAYRQMNGKEMALVSPNASVLEVLRLSGLLKIFKIQNA